MAKSKKEMVLTQLAVLEQKLTEQMNFERYEFMERPEIAQISKGRQTAFQASVLMVRQTRKEIQEEWK